MLFGFEFEEMNFAPEGVSSRHEIYWHHNLKEGLEECDECQVVFTQGDTSDLLQVFLKDNISEDIPGG